jgi:hypothetical protein
MSDSTALHVSAAAAPPAPIAIDGDDFPFQPDAATEPEALLQRLGKGWIELDGTALRRHRLSRFMSQRDLANDCWRRDIRVSLATIKRAECGHRVRFRVARELARCFGVPVPHLLHFDAACAAPQANASASRGSMK